MAQNELILNYETTYPTPFDQLCLFFPRPVTASYLENGLNENKNNHILLSNEKESKFIDEKKKERKEITSINKYEVTIPPFLL